MKASRTLLPAIAAACLIVSIGCSADEAPEPAQPSPVRTARAEKANLLDRIQLSGRVVPPIGKDVTLSPLVPGRLASVTVRQGDRVKKGQRLAGLEAATFAAAVSSARAAEHRAVADMEFRQREATRTRSLFEKGVASRHDAESDEAAAVAAESARVEASTALAEAERRQEWAELRAPFDGIVLRVMRSAGEQVDGTPGTPVMEVAAEKPVEIAADATGAVLPRIAEGEDAEIAVTGPLTQDASSEASGQFPAHVTQVAHAVDPATGVGEVRLQLTQSDAVPLIGSAVTVRITLNQRPDAIVVPAGALRRGEDGQPEVVLLEAGKARIQSVQTGLAEEGRVEILSGLSEGDEVVVDDPNGIVNGAALKKLP